MEINEKTILGELVAENYNYAKVFRQHYIDFFCHGNRSLGETIIEQNLDLEKIIAQLNTIDKTSIPSEDYRTWSLDLLADHIEETHHRFTEASITKLKPQLAELVETHRETYPELVELEKIFNTSAGDMASHMKKEEIILFPFIRRMLETKKSQTKITVPHFGTVENPVNMMIHEHDEQSKLLKQMVELTNNYTIPSNASEDLKNVYISLKAFDEDMQKHIHLENNILFPKAVALEKTLKKDSF